MRLDEPAASTSAARLGFMSGASGRRTWTSSATMLRAISSGVFRADVDADGGVHPAPNRLE